MRKEKYNVFPQHAVLFALCLGPLFAGATAAEASWNTLTSVIYALVAIMAATAIYQLLAGNL